jgi:hypothetical protein
LAVVRALFLCGLIAASAFAESPVSFRGEIAPLVAAALRGVSWRGVEQREVSGSIRSRGCGKPGESALPTLTPGKPEESEIYNLIVEPSANDRMPQKADALAGRGDRADRALDSRRARPTTAARRSGRSSSWRAESLLRAAPGSSIRDRCR